MASVPVASDSDSARMAVVGRESSIDGVYKASYTPANEAERTNGPSASPSVDQSEAGPTGGLGESVGPSDVRTSNPQSAVSRSAKSSVPDNHVSVVHGAKLASGRVPGVRSVPSAAQTAASKPQTPRRPSRSKRALAAGTQTVAQPRSAAPTTDSQTPLNRVRQVREQQGVSLRSFAKRLGLDARTSRALEDPHRDLLLSELMAIHRALDVPLADLLEESDELSRPVAERAKMVKVMKTAVAIRETSTHLRLKRMGEMLCEQLREVMPELADVTGWPQYGARRGKSAVGKALASPVDLSDLSGD